MRISVWAFLGLLGDGVFCRIVDEKAPIATISPCPAAPISLAPPPITVTSQYQAVSTCEAQTACMKRRCTTKYSYQTYDYVSTVIPGPDSSTTVTRTDQPVLISRSSKTITDKYVMTVLDGHNSSTTTTTAYTTAVKEWSALYKDIGALALPDYAGSGLCDSCEGLDGEQRQKLEVIECLSGPQGPVVCSQGIETWLYNRAPTSTKKATAVCSSRAFAAVAGIFTFAFPQTAAPATFRIPERTVTYKIGRERPSVVTTTVMETETIIPGQEWTAYVTRSCVQPTTFDFSVTITKTIIYTVPPFVVPCST